MINIISPYPSVDCFYTENITDNEGHVELIPIKQKAGGKGINTARTFRYLDTKSRVFTILGFYNGFKIKELCKKENIKIKFIRTESESRTHLIINKKDNSFSSLKPQSTKLSKTDIKSFLTLIEKTPFKGNQFLFSGSLNPGLPKLFYNEIMSILYKRFPDCKFTLDINGTQLLLLDNASPYPIDLIKINQKEWETWHQIKFSEESFFSSCEALHDSNINQVIVTNKGNKTYYSSRNNKLIVIPNSADKIVQLGAGDAFLAGFLWGQKQLLSIKESLQIGSEVALQYISDNKIHKISILENFNRHILKTIEK